MVEHTTRARVLLPLLKSKKGVSAWAGVGRELDARASSAQPKWHTDTVHAHTRFSAINVISPQRSNGQPVRRQQYPLVRTFIIPQTIANEVTASTD